MTAATPDPETRRRLEVPRGIRNHNPGNIDRRPGVRWQGQAEDQSGDSRFVVFTAPRWGIRAIARILITYQDARQAKDGSRIDTIREIIERWAPPVENDTSAYARHVAALTMIGVNDKIDVYDYTTMRAIVIAIIIHENGGNPYSDAEIDASLKLAGIEPPRQKLVRQTDVAATVGAGAITLLGAVVDTVQHQLPQAAQTAQTMSEIAPGWVKPLLVGLVLGLLALALLKQIYDHRSGAR